MKQETSPLPDFDRPPVTEVALSIQFEPLNKLSVPLLGLYWQTVRDRFPNVEQQPPLIPTVERTGAVQEFTFPLQLQLGQTAQIPRLWFVSANQREMIQVQSDRFIRNWRKRASEDPYPRYRKNIFPAFQDELKEFRSFLSTEKLDHPRVNQCEINYVNQILVGEGWERHADLEKVFTLVSTNAPNSKEIVFEDGRLYFRYTLTRNNSFIGRLHIVIDSGFEPNSSKPILIATLTARGRPLSDTDDGIYGFFDLGHEAIVRTFAKITTPVMHEIWRRKDVTK